MRLVLLILLPVLLSRCSPSGDRVGSLAPPESPSPEVEQQAIRNLVQLYGQALVQEDIDRLQSLFAPETSTLTSQAQAIGSPTRQASDDAFTTPSAFRDHLSDTFRTHTVTALRIPEEQVQITSDLQRVTFLEIESTLDPSRWLQQTRVYRTTLQLTRTETASTVTFRIGGATRQGPLVQITTPGQVQGGTLARVTVRDPAGLFALASGMVHQDTTASEPTLRSIGDRLTGTVFVPSGTSIATLHIDLQSSRGETLAVTHTLRVRQAVDQVVQPTSGTTGTPLQAVTVARDGTVWAGGANSASLYRVTPGGIDAEWVGQLVSDPGGRIEDLLEDDRGRLQAVIFGQQTSGVVVYDQGIFCQTVNAVDLAYPLQTPDGRPSVSTRASAAADGAIWLHGSDAGIALATDDVLAGGCPDHGVTVTYDPVLRREDGLPVNTVPALLAEADGTLWIGSALGLARLQDGQVTRVPFDPDLSFQGNPETLEAFFATLAQAIAAAQPVDSLAIGNVSFVEAFGSPLIKEDLIFSLARDSQGRLWVVTLGGGVRRVERVNGEFRDTWHLTREDGLAGNVVFAIAVAQDDTVWVATDDGVSRIQEVDGEPHITNYTAVDGLSIPARDIAVDASGAAWVATDAGLYRIATQGGAIAGGVRDANGQPVANADVGLFGTPFHAVTDASGQFALAHLPTGTHQLLVDGQLASGGPFGLAAQHVVVSSGSQNVAPLTVSTGDREVGVDPGPGGQVTFPLVPGAELDIPPQSGSQGPVTLGLAFLDAAELPAPLPPGFTAVAAAALQPAGTTFSPPATLTLPNHAQLPAGQLVILMRFDDQTETYEQLGLGRVSADGSVINTLSGGLTSFSTVVYAATGEHATRLFLVRVSGNNQRVEAGVVALPEPLVVRLEDQFGNPVAGEVVTASIIRGDWTIVDADQVTDAQGEARFEAQTGGTGSGADFVAQVTAPELADVRPVQFLAIVGDLDTPGFPEDLAAAGDVVYVANSNGLLVIDVSDPTRPELLHTLPLKKDRSLIAGGRSLAIDGMRLYVGTGFPARLYAVDISNPHAPDFATDRDGDGLADVFLSFLDLPGDVLGKVVKDLVVRDGLVYAVSNTFTTDPATLYVADMKDPDEPRLLSATPLPVPNPRGLAVVGDVVYVVARGAGLLVFDVRDPTMPRLLTTLPEPESNDAVTIALSSGITVAGSFAYVMETQEDETGNQPTDRLVVFDIRTPAAPRRRGSVLLTPRSQVPLSATGLTVAAPFAYAIRGFFGLEALDIRNPDAPVRLGFVDIPSEALQVDTAGGFIYVIDEVFGLQVIRGPSATQVDTDDDGIIDFFDAFPTDPAEFQDSDGDRVGDHADDDDDNDGFSDAEEAAATPPTNARDPLSFPVRVPPPGVTTMVVDATTPLVARAREGTPEAPYRSVTEALRALRSGFASAVDILRLRAGIYSPVTTQEIIPLDLDQLSNLTIQAETPGSVTLDGGFRGDVINARFNEDVVIEGFVVTHGAIGMQVRHSAHVTIRGNQVRDNNEDGIRIIGPNANTGIVVADNRVEDNGSKGINVLGNAAATVTRNRVRRNEDVGINITLSSTAEVIDNVAEQNNAQGIVIFDESTATITGNTSSQNGLAGILVFASTATLTANTVTENGTNGITVNAGSIAELLDNMVVGNGVPEIAAPLPPNLAMFTGNGVLVEGSSVVTISSGVITQSDTHGVRVFVGPLNPAGASATVRIGLDSDSVVEITDNGGAGIFVADDGSDATIDSRNIVFGGNAEGDTVGNVIDLAP